MAVDGITLQFEKFTKEVLENIGTEATESIKEEVDKFSNQYENDIRTSIPKKSGDLENSFKMKKDINSINWYGYNFRFEGVDKNNIPYEKIANVLNYGRQAGYTDKGRRYPTITPKRFIEKAIRKLKKLNPAIDENFESKMQELNKKA